MLRATSAAGRSTKKQKIRKSPLLWLAMFPKEKIYARANFAHADYMVKVGHKLLSL